MTEIITSSHRLQTLQTQASPNSPQIPRTTKLTMLRGSRWAFRFIPMPLPSPLVLEICLSTANIQGIISFCWPGGKHAPEQMDELGTPCKSSALNQEVFHTTKPRGIHPSQISKWLKCKQRTHKTFTLLNYFTQFFWAQNNNKGKVLLTGIFASSDLKLILSGCCGVMN